MWIWTLKFISSVRNGDFSYLRPKVKKTSFLNNFFSVFFCFFSDLLKWSIFKLKYRFKDLIYLIFCVESHGAMLSNVRIHWKKLLRLDIQLKIKVFPVSFNFEIPILCEVINNDGSVRWSHRHPRVWHISFSWDSSLWQMFWRTLWE